MAADNCSTFCRPTRAVLQMPTDDRRQRAKQ